MGGSGSGRYQSYQARQTVEDGICLSIFRLVNVLHVVSWNVTTSGKLAWSETIYVDFTCTQNVLILEYNVKVRGEWQAVKASYQLSQTHPYFGGHRIWIHCTCGKRCGKLYLAPGSDRFLCRQCGQLTYKSTREMTFAERELSLQRRMERFIAKYGSR